MSNLGKLFNSTTITGRANVAKATYATIALLYLIHRLRKRNEKSAKGVCSSCDKGEGGDDAASSSPYATVGKEAECTTILGDKGVGTTNVGATKAPNDKKDDGCRTISLWDGPRPDTDNSANVSTDALPVRSGSGILQTLPQPPLPQKDSNADERSDAASGNTSEIEPENLKYRSRRRRLSMPLQRP